MPTVNEFKQHILNQSLNKGKTTVMVNTTISGVLLPEHLMKDFGAIINLSRRFPGPLKIEAYGVMATLRFQGEPFAVVLPWESIMGVRNDTELYDFSPLQKIPGDTHMEVTENNPDSEPAREPFKPEIVVDNTEKLGLSELTLTPPRTGHLRLLPN